MEHPAGMAGEPPDDFGRFMGGDVVEHNVDDLAGWDFALESVQKAEELLMPMALYAAAEHRAVENVERGKERGGAVALVVMGHRAAFAGFQRQAGLMAWAGRSM